MRAFVAVARSGSFTSAAQVLDLAPSVLTKRVSQLEHSIRATLLHRTTRKVMLTDAGEYHLARIAATVAAYDETFLALRRGVQRLEGAIRIKVPSTLGFLHLDRLIWRFAREHPGVSIEVLLLDGPLNPAMEGVDIAVTAFPASFDGVTDEILWPLPRGLFASPDYLARHDQLEHPRQLEGHDCVVFQPTGSSWPFLSQTGLISVTVQPRLASNDMVMLLDAVKEGAGIGLFSSYVVKQAFDAGLITTALQGFPVPDLWVKAMIPSDRRELPRVNALLEFLRTEGEGQISGNSFIQAGTPA